jgi:threonine/homoserine/homoserine lactone efflux protein
VQELELLGRGLIAGLVIAAPPGPVNVLCMQRTLARGLRSGLACGFGAAAGDTLYGATAAFSINTIIALLVRELPLIRLLGGSLLVAAGLYCFRRRPIPRAAYTSGGDLISTFLLSLANPTVVLSFLAVLAGLGLGGLCHWESTAFVVAGIFCGSMLWWTTLSVMVMRVRACIDERRLKWLNRLAGLAMAGFGAGLILLSQAAK